MNQTHPHTDTPIVGRTISNIVISLLRRLPVLLFGVVLSATAFAQTDFEKSWNEVRDLQKKGLFNEAFPKAEKLFDQAVRQHNSPEILRAAFSLGQIEAGYRENSADSTLARYLRILPTLQPREASLCNLFIAQHYSEYLLRNSWRIRSNKDTDESDLDYKLWSEKRFTSTIRGYFEAALKDTLLLQQTPVGYARHYCADFATAEGLLTTPTLFDLIVQSGVAIVSDREYGKQLWHRLLAFHQQDSKDDLPIWIELRLADYCGMGEDCCIFLKQLLDKYRSTTSPMLAEIYSELAHNLHFQGREVEAKSYCDTAISRFSGTKGAVACENLSRQIQQPQLSLTMGNSILMAERANLAEVQYSNTDKLYFRIIENDGSQDRFLKSKPLRQWNLAVPSNSDYSSQKSLVCLPPLTAGDYVLMASVSSDFESAGFVANSFVVEKIQFVATTHFGLDGVLLDLRTGAPVPNQKVELVQRLNNDKEQLKAVSTTDQQGHYHFDMASSLKSYWGFFVQTHFEGRKVTFDCEGSFDHAKVSEHVDCFIDRPVYKPGDTLRFSLLEYLSDGRTKGAVLPNDSLTCLLRDVNFKEIGSIRLCTDSLGAAFASFPIAPDAMPGRYLLSVVKKTTLSTVSFSVEEYKQPKFLVSLPQDSSVHHFGETVSLRLLAVSFNGVPINGARVKWSVICREQHLNRWMDFVSPNIDEVASGEGETNQLGEFVISFVPQPLSKKTEGSLCNYLINAEVTDITGETRSGQVTLSVANVNSILSLLGDSELREVSDLRFSYTNLDNRPLDGSIRVELERVELPKVPKLRHPLLSNDVGQTMSQTEFEKDFPLLAYGPTDFDSTTWRRTPVASYRVEAVSSRETNPLHLPELNEGLYRIRVSLPDNQVDSVSSERYFTIMPPHAKKVCSQELLWCDVDKLTAEVGEKVLLRLGSRFDDVHLFYALVAHDKLCKMEHLPLGRDLCQLEFPVAEDYLGGFDIAVLAVKDNIVVRKDYHIAVPFSHKKLQVEFVSFRDRLLPGQQECWTLKIKGATPQDSYPAHLVLTMYDAALDSYARYGSAWRLAPWKNYFSHDLFRLHYVYGFAFDLQKQVRFTPYNGPEPYSWQLQGAWPLYTGSRMWTKSARGEYAMSENGLVMSAAQKAVADDAVEYEMAYSEEESVSLEMQDAPQMPLRNNLSTLGFFYPNLKTDTAGSVEIHFSVPDLLTQWAVKGVAWNRSLSCGDLIASTVTQKPLMVQPNVPRFLRQGDTVDFLAKVSNLTTAHQSVKVRLEMRDANTGRPFFADSLFVDVEPSLSSQVRFRFVVPGNIFVATYTWVAEGDGCSDGEQGPIVVLTNRELVTESMAIYLNGIGEKHYAFEHLMQSDSSTTLTNHLVAVEFASNPIWYAIQALPFVADCENPSSLYRVNALYANMLAKHIVSQNPKIEKVFEAWCQGDSSSFTSNLAKNEDLKQLLLEATPFLQEGNDEREHKRQIANYFNEQSLRKQLEFNQQKLLKAQSADGGWSWMPDAHSSSQYITQYILKMNGLLVRASQRALLPSRSVQNAINYLDKETYAYYKKYLKNHPDCDATNIDYLYTRSFYPKALFLEHTREAYNYYYNNARKHYAEYNALYTLAQMALIFERHGDHSLALDVARRLKGSALFSDEMGMYWRDNVSGRFWNERPIEVQALLINVFDEVLHDSESVALMQQWLLKQKQTTRWNSDVASANAIAALLCGGGKALLQQDENSLTVTVGNETLSLDAEAGTGYLSQRWQGDAVAPQMGHIAIRKTSPGIAWGAVYWQYLEDLDKIPYSEMGIKMVQKYYRVEPNDSLTLLYEGSVLHLGDRVRVQLLIDCDRNLEYVEIKEPRAACMEPLSTASGWHFSPRDGLGYYEVVGNLNTTLFVDRLNKGQYLVESDYWITNPGSFTTGLTTAQCLYSPEFRTTHPSAKLTVR